jgi:uncharacterized membrane protein YeaQ/YmgE (transglycosylase-associated protein family)
MSLEPMTSLACLAVGVIAGALAGLATNGLSRLANDLILGLVGAYLGGFVAGAFDFERVAGLEGTVAVAAIGAVALIAFVRTLGAPGVRS